MKIFPKFGDIPAYIPPTPSDLTKIITSVTSQMNKRNFF